MGHVELRHEKALSHRWDTFEKYQVAVCDLSIKGDATLASVLQ